jgi:hypothetical protein
MARTTPVPQIPAEQFAIDDGELVELGPVDGAPIWRREAGT